VRKQPRIKIVAANGFRNANEEALRPLLKLEQVSFDFGNVATASEVGRLVQAAAANRVLFGSGAPLHAIESTAGKLLGSRLDKQAMHSIAARNAARLTGGRE
jgi:predicted TIM-barrel fold metal-dependent hydrolase